MQHTGPAAQRAMRAGPTGCLCLQETLELCFACLQTAAVEGSQEIVCGALPHDSLRLQHARQRLTTSLVAWLKQCPAPLPLHAPALMAIMQEQLQHMSKEELLAVSLLCGCGEARSLQFRVLNLNQAYAPCAGGACCLERV